MNAIAFANLSVGKDILKMRLKAGFSQAEVARKAGIRPEMLCRIESGNGNPTVSTVTKIVHAVRALSRRRA